MKNLNNVNIENLCYGVFESTSIDFASGIHPVPSTLLKVFKSVYDAIEFMKQRRSNIGHEKYDFCDDKSFPLAIVFLKNGCDDYTHKIFVKEYHLE